MTTIVFDGDRLYADTQISSVRGDEMVSATLTEKIHSDNRATWASAGSKLVADLFNNSVMRFGMLHLRYQWLWDCDRNDHNHFANISGGNTILYVTKKYVHTLTTTNRTRTIKLFGLRLHFMFIRVSSKRDRRQTINWIAIGSGCDLADKYLKAGHTPDVAIKLAAIKDLHTNSLLQTVDCK